MYTGPGVQDDDSGELTFGSKPPERRHSLLPPATNEASQSSQPMSQPMSQDDESPIAQRVGQLVTDVHEVKERITGLDTKVTHEIGGLKEARKPTSPELLPKPRGTPEVKPVTGKTAWVTLRMDRCKPWEATAVIITNVHKDDFRAIPKNADGVPIVGVSVEGITKNLMDETTARNAEAHAT